MVRDAMSDRNPNDARPSKSLSHSEAAQPDQGILWRAEETTGGGVRDVTEALLPLLFLSFQS